MHWKASYVWARRFGYLRTDVLSPFLFPHAVDSSRDFESSIAWCKWTVNSFQRASDSLAHIRTAVFNACEKGNRINVPTHINAHFARYLAFLFYYIYLNVWIFKSKQANTIQHYTLIHIIVKKCNDNCSKPRQHRTSNKYPDLVLI